MSASLNALLDACVMKIPLTRCDSTTCFPAVRVKYSSRFPVVDIAFSAGESLQTSDDNDDPDGIGVL